MSYTHSSKHACSSGCISNTCPVQHPKSCRAHSSQPCPQGASHHHHRCAGLPSVQLLNEGPRLACPDPFSLLYHLAVMCCCSSSSLPPLFSVPLRAQSSAGTWRLLQGAARTCSASPRCALLLRPRCQPSLPSKLLKSN